MYRREIQRYTHTHHNGTIFESKVKKIQLIRSANESNWMDFTDILPPNCHIWKWILLLSFQRVHCRNVEIVADIAQLVITGPPKRIQSFNQNVNVQCNAEPANYFLNVTFLLLCRWWNAWIVFFHSHSNNINSCALPPSLKTKQKHMVK